MKQDPRGPRDFYAPPRSGPSGPDTAWRRVTFGLAPLYLAFVAGTLLIGYSGVCAELTRTPRAPWIEPGLQVCFWGSILTGWLLSFAAFLVRRHEKTPVLAVFVLLSGFVSGGLFALVSLPIAGDPGDSDPGSSGDPGTGGDLGAGGDPSGGDPDLE